MNKKELNDYISSKVAFTIPTYRCRYHMTPRVGWMNDPNGLIRFRDGYHLYYQSNPLRTRPGHMTWGHFVSEDLISYTDKGVALALEDPREHAYSGGAIEIDGKIHVLYTLHQEKRYEEERYDGEVLEGNEIFTEAENEIRKTMPKEIETEEIKTERIFHSSSPDGSGFEKGTCAFDNASLPPNLSRADFRDPCPVRIGDAYYVFLGGKDVNKNQGVVVVLKGNDLDKLEYAFQIGPYYEFGDMAECPSYRRIDGKDVLLVCGSNTPRRDNDFRNINCSVALVGHIDFAGKKMDVEFIKELDKGDSFYAPQFIANEKDPILVGWLEMWGKRYPTSRLRHGYVGAFSIPREIHVRDGDLYQWPIAALSRYEHDADEGSLPRQARIQVRLGTGDALVFKGENGRLTIGNAGRGVYLDNSEANSSYQCARWTNSPYPEADILILLDTSSAEIFVEGGKEVISTRFYIDGRLSLHRKGNPLVSEIKKIME